MSIPPGKTTFTLTEVSRLLSCHRDTLRHAILDGELRAAKLGREYRISRSDLESFWTEKGGGDLFGKTDEEAEDSAPRPSGKKRSGKKGAERQLSLFTPDGSRSDED